MSSFLVFILTLLLRVIHCQVNTTLIPQTTIATTSTTQYFTTSTPVCSSNYAFVYIQSSNISQTILSERVNFPPYTYSNDNLVNNKKIVTFDGGSTSLSNITINNPCDSSTWNQPSSYYSDNIILISYSSYFDDLCTTQKWIINLQQYTSNTIHAVLIGNDDELTGVYDLNGDINLIPPSIPTRMISKISYDKIISTINKQQDVYGSINCFNDTSHPPIICVSDSATGINWDNLVLDGEYQEQGLVFLQFVIH